MNKLWKIFGITALAAAVPLRIKKNEETGKTRYQSLLLGVDVGPNEDNEGTSIDINIGEGILSGAITSAVTAKKESELFADDDPAAAVVDLEPEPEPAEESEAPEPVSEYDFDPEL